MIIVKSANKWSNRILYNQNKGIGMVVKMQWLTSQEKRLMRIRRFIRDNFNEFNRFFTLTLKDSELVDDFDLSKHISKVMNRIRTYYKKRHPQRELKYLWKIEHGEKTGRIHIHMITNFFIPVKMLNKWWEKGFVQAKFIRNKKMAVNYLGKYFGKDGKIELKGTKHKKIRQFDHSRNFKETKKKSGWKVIGEELMFEHCLKILMERQSEFEKDNEIWILKGILDYSPEIVYDIGKG